MLCQCGMTHAEVVTRVSVGRNITNILNEWLRAGGYKRALVVADSNTAVYAREIMPLLTSVTAEIFVFEDKMLTPDESAVQRLLQAAGPDGVLYEVLVAVGSGTINDLTRYVSHRQGLPYYVVATAASMDGYTSTVAPLTVNGLKQTLSAVAPLGVIGDTAILETAPSAMTAAGYGDLTGKWTCLNDWELGHIVTGEPYCPGLVDDMRQAVAACEPPEGDAIAPVMEALLRSGMVMQQIGNSRPASGSEHHLSHFWEMMCLLRGQVPALHGAKVGVATLAVIRVNEWLATEPVDWARAYHYAKAYDPAVWQGEARRIFGRAADEVIDQWQAEDAAEKIRRVDILREKWPEITDAISRNIPPYERIKAGLVRRGGPVSPYDIGVGREDFINGVLHARRVRPRFTVWTLADALGLLPEYAKRLAEVNGL